MIVTFSFPFEPLQSSDVVECDSCVNEADSAEERELTHSASALQITKLKTGLICSILIVV